MSALRWRKVTKLFRLLGSWQTVLLMGRCPMWLKLPVAGDIFEVEGTKCNIGARLDIEETTREGGRHTVSQYQAELQTAVTSILESCYPYPSVPTQKSLPRFKIPVHGFKSPIFRK